MNIQRSMMVFFYLMVLTPLQTLANISHMEPVFPKPNGYSMHGFAETGLDTVVAVGLASTVLRSVDAGLSWIQIQAPTLTSPDYYDVEILSDGTLIAAGQEPGVFISNDGGFNWWSPDLPSGSLFRDVCLTPDGVVLVSDDQGLTWQDVGPGEGLISFHLWRPNQECLIAIEKEIQLTTNGGLTWNPVLPELLFGYNEIFEVTSSHIVAWADGRRFDSFDGGATWDEPDVDNITYPFRTVVIDSLHWLLAGFKEGAEIFETFNGGETWNFRLFQRTRGMTCLTQLGNGNFLAASSDGLIFESDDLFTTYDSAWETLLLERPNTSIRQMASRADGVLFASGNTQIAPIITSWLRSDDQGDTWQILEGGPQGYLLDLVFGENDQALAASFHILQYSNDGGLTWATGFEDHEFTILDLAIASEDNFFATANTFSTGHLLTSGDGGATWSSVEGGLPEGTLRDAQVDFLNTQEGWATDS